MTEREGMTWAEDGGVLTLTLDRPKKLNAITAGMIDVLWEAARALGDRDDVRVLVITGTGRYFTAGVDISEDARKEHKAREGPTTSRLAARRKYRLRHHTLFDELEAIEKPVVLAAQGPCIGLGLELAASCDFRFCTPATHFGLPEVKLGVLPASGGISRLTRLVGPHWSKWLAMAGREVDAETARSMGLVHEVLPEAGFLEAVQAFAAELVALPEEVVGLAKLTIDMAVAEDREKTRNLERIATSALYGAKGRGED